MHRLVLLVLVFANLGQAPAVKGGSVTGTVRAVQNGRAVKHDSLYVYLVRHPQEPLLVGDGFVARITQYDEKFTPEVTVIPQGAKIFFPNREDKEHNVFSPSVKANGWYGFDLGRYRFDAKGKHRVFPDPGEFDIYCDVHKDMRAKVKVVPTRLFKKVSDDGKFTLTDVPPGTYTVVAWALDSNEKRTVQPIEVKVGATVQAETLNVQYAPKSPAHPRKDGSEYGPYPPR